MTPTSAKDRRDSEHGLTLFELLIVLALLALIAMFVTGSVRASSPRLAVKLASEQLLADVKRARLEAETVNAPVAIDFDGASYIIADLSLHRTVPAGVDVQITGGNGAGIILGPGYRLTAYQITLSKGKARSTLHIDAITRKARLQ